LREYGQVRTKFWTDGRVAKLSDDAKFMFLFMLTGPHTTALGCFRLPAGYVQEDLGWTAPRVSKGFEELLAKGLIKRDETTGWTLVTHFLRYNHPANPNQGKRLATLFEEIPEEIAIYGDLVVSLLGCPEQRFLPKPFRNHLETLSEQLAQPFRNTESESESDTESESESSTYCPTGKPAGPHADVSKEGPETPPSPKEPPDEPFYLTKKGRKLTGWKLQAFEVFWSAFDYKNGKSQAADSWLDIPGLTRELAKEKIIPAARLEARRRPELKRKGRTPIYAQGWLSSRRWEDEALWAFERSLNGQDEGGRIAQLLQEKKAAMAGGGS